ncbi:hypothetical protein GO685_03395 [Wolbachia endosymbiont of Madathamugadia hiepei]|uniref:hypothetical protein n=1 Tax=Wolbachia endosymbiont of Madathamugadia hiepei TaxID=1241303 RepID=UPI00158C304F|nr:hypothetical protein [Wolbachia endosymbiont of Madathamugadia hiepei]NUX01529.1 hypothetical protein [Wolbachia endosymbiont of Madathamugadia hiepei]
MNLLEIIRREGIRYDEKIRELQEFLNDSSEILVNKGLFTAVLSTKAVLTLTMD